MKQLCSLVLVALAMVLFPVDVVWAEQHDRLIPLLIGIEGWEAKPASGRSMVSGSMKMISAHRTYSKGEKGITASLMVSSGAIQESELQEASYEDNANRLRIRSVHGFWVKTTINKNKNSGQVTVYLDHNQDAKALLLVNYLRMDEDEVLANLEKLKWDEIKVVVSSML